MGESADSLLTARYFAEPYEVIEAALSRCSDRLRALQGKAHYTLMRKVRADSLVQAFDFPAELAVPCEQYLLYFVQFLRDLGVEATAEVEHRASDVLFSVTPQDKTLALEKVREALDVYLSLATCPVPHSASMVSYSSEIAIQRLEAEIMTLHGRVRMGFAEIQMKDATIRAKETEIDLLRRVLESKPVPSPLLTDGSTTPQPEKGKDREEFFNGMVALKPYDFKVGEINVPVIIRKLRESFQKKKPADRGPEENTNA